MARSKFKKFTVTITETSQYKMDIFLKEGTGDLNESDEYNAEILAREKFNNCKNNSSYLISRCINDVFVD